MVKLLAASSEVSTFIPVLADLFAGRVTEIPVAHAERRHGESKYSLWKLFRLQFDLMTSFSVLPLRVTMGVGVVMAIVAFLVALVLIAGRLIYGQEWAVSGVFTLFALVFFFLGAQLFAIGLLGEYVGRIYQQVRDRPRYVIRQVIRGEGTTPLRAVVLGYHTMGCLGFEALLAPRLRGGRRAHPSRRSARGGLVGFARRPRRGARRSGALLEDPKDPAFRELIASYAPDFSSLSITGT